MTFTSELDLDRIKMNQYAISTLQLKVI